MNKAVLDLNVFKDVKNQDIESFMSDWKTIPGINMWLKVRKFDLNEPIFVTKSGNHTLTFFQGKDPVNKLIVVVNRNKSAINDIKHLLSDHTIVSFTNVHDANLFMTNNKPNIIVIPKNLKISRSLTYNDYVKKFYPGLKVITTNSGSGKDLINLKVPRNEYIKSLQKENTNVI